MAQSGGAFTLTINTNAGFGETGKAYIENTEIGMMLRRVAQEVQSGVASRHIIDRNGNDVGSYSYGAGTINSGR
jgi:hypothetical protein